MPPTARSFFLHTIPTPPSPPLSPQHHLLHSTLCSRRRHPARRRARATIPHTRRNPVANESSVPPRRNLEFFPTTRWSGRSSSSHNTAGHDPRTLSSPPNWLPMSLHGACRRNNHVAPREARAHNTPHATPSTDKSCTSRTANIPHSTAPASKPRLDAGSNSHHWPIHPSKARCVQVFRHDNAKRAHNIPHADAEKQGLGIEGEKMLRERSSFFGASTPRSPRVSCTAVKCYFRALHSS